jgi:type I restriction enzyme S subunit
VFAVPPLKEAQSISAKLRQSVAAVDSAIRDVERESALLQEFRTGLIADVVAGKLDVRVAAARLPDFTGADSVDEPADDEDLEETTDAPENEEVAA